MKRHVHLPLPLVSLAAGFWGLWVLLILYHAVFFMRHLTDDFSCSWGDFGRGLLLTAKFDLNTMAYLCLPPLLLMTISLLWMTLQPVLVWINRNYIRLIMGGMIFLLMIDIEYYSFFNTHLDAYFYAYQSLDEWWPILGTVHEEYSLYWVIPLLILFMAGWFKLVNRWLGWMERQFSGRNQKYRYNALLLLIILPFYFLILRGSTGIYALNWGEAFYSQNDFLNQNVLNGGYTLMRAIFQDYQDHQRDLSLDRLMFVPVDSALEETRRQVLMSNEAWVPDSPYPLARRIVPDTARPSQHYNLVFIIMETFSSHFNGRMGANPSDSPCFDSLCEHGVFFERFYATGFRTNSAISSLLSSFPPVLGTSVLKQMEGKSIPSVAQILKPFGYRSVFIYGGDANFDNMKGYLIGTGFDECLDQTGMVSRFKNKWGVPDEDIFAAAHRRFLSYGDQPFVSAILTISNHEPFQLPPWVKPFYPDREPMAKYRNTYRYSDQALGRFFELAAGSSYFNRTIFFICADHGRNYQSEAYYDIRRFHIPACLIAPGIVPESLKTISTVTGQIDVIPMMLYWLNLPVVHSCWGRNPWLIDGSDGRAIWTRNPTIGSRLKEHYSIDELNGSTRVFRVDSLEIVRQSLAQPDSLSYYRRYGRILTQSAVYCLKNRLSRY